MLIKFNQDLFLIKNLFINYKTNLMLAEISLIEHFSRDVQEIATEDQSLIQNLNSYLLLIPNNRILLIILIQNLINLI